MRQLEGHVLVTGGAGFLARAIYRRAKRESWPARFTAVSRNEDSQSRLHQKYPDVRCAIGDVRNFSRMRDLMYGHDVVIHAAALKRVPESESLVVETIETNVNGSLNVAMAAHAAGVPLVIGISTDKAVNPQNVYGASKMLMERIFIEANGWHGQTRFMVTRYGNVVASTGSIVPIFRRQLAEKGRVTVTDPEMTRFWMSPDEAVDSVLDACQASEEYPGFMTVRRCGAMGLLEVARVIAGEAPVDIVGARPGEKQHESLLSAHEAVRATATSTTYDSRDEPSRIMLIAPTVAARTWPAAIAGEYTSDHPDYWFTHEQMASMIADAETI